MSGGMPRAEPVSERPSRIIARSALACLCGIGLACGGSDAGDGFTEAEGVPATLLRTLDEGQTVGPLFDVKDAIFVGDDLWILDAGNKRLVALASGGATVFGRDGDGPGEFRAPDQLTPLPWDEGAPAEATVWDRQLRRASHFDGAGSLVGTERLHIEAPGLSVYKAFRLRDVWALVLRPSLSADDPPEDEAGAGALVLVPVSGGLVDTLHVFDRWGPIAFWNITENRVSLRAFTPPYDAPPVADMTRACGGLVGVSIGGRRLRIMLLDGDGHPVGEITDDVIGPEVTPNERDEYWALFPDSTIRRFDLKDQVRVPEHHPAVQELQMTSTGLVMVRTTPRRRLEKGATWRVWRLVRSGRDEVGAEVVGDWRLPLRFTPFEARGDTLWGRRLDEMDVPRIESMTVDRPVPVGCSGE